MSLHLYPRRIFWDGRAGCIRNDPHLHMLNAPPYLPGCALNLTEIDYAPGVIAQLREGSDRTREMRDEEITACDALLARMLRRRGD